ncbi:MAG: hypothetical protein C0410_02665 [Anaerolinea sp.]|nr:hypothetical protein [Anaerolinea sp.]
MNNNLEPITVRLVLKDMGWIFEKFAVRLVENLSNWNVQADIAAQPSPDVDINHFIYFNDFNNRKVETHSKNTLWVTHVDRPASLWYLRNCLKKADMAICMSRMTLEELARRGIKREKLCFISPAQDGQIKPRRIIIGITSRMKPDRCKNEKLLIKLAQTTSLDVFHFEIIGRGWEKVIPYLEEAGATVRFFPGTENGLEDYKINLERVPTFDYYLYLGFDEGSMGLLDALAAGVPTIVTPQGFHLDINGGIIYPFTNLEELRAIFSKLSLQRQSLVDCVAGLTWKEYARQHALVWRTILNGGEDGISDLLHGQTVFTTPLPKRSRKDTLVADIQFYANTNLMAFHHDWQILVKMWTGIEPAKTPIWRFLKRLVSPKQN